MPVAKKKAARSTRPARRAASPLSEYYAKRDLRASGEPGGSGKAKQAKLPRFVIQKHDATRLHFDVRLEMEGVYRSWAVPKGLPGKPGDKALAVEVEDHPLDYGTFEGTIPEGNYGAGTVMLWDRGTYEVHGTSPEQAFREGKIHFTLHGEKCIGSWTLVRMRNRGDEKKNWLAIKNHDEVGGTAFSDADLDRSVKTGRTMDEITNGARRSAAKKKTSRTRAVAGARPRPRAKARAAAPSPSCAEARNRTRKQPAAYLTPEYVEPMKALGVDAVAGPDWLLEIKYDGYRALTIKAGEDVEIWSRNHKSLTDHYPEIVEAARKLDCESAILDGEVAALDDQGRPTFQLLQARANQGRSEAPLVYYVFDLLDLDGESLLDRPIEERKEKLNQLLRKPPEPLRVSPVFEQEPAVLLEEVRRTGLEGIIGKRRGSPYEPGRRSGTWVKKRIAHDQEFVVAGYTPPQGGRTHFGAVLVGYYDGDQLLYAGKVGTGFDAKSLRELHARFKKLEAPECPFANLPSPKKPRYGQGMTAAAMREVTWLRPELVAQIKFSEWTRDGSLRQPVFLGLRDDKRPREVVREN